MPPSADPLPRYQALAEELRSAIHDGRLPAGARLPSVREAAQHRDLSINTILAAYRQLETQGLVEARPQSGYFVKPRLASPEAVPAVLKPTSARPVEAAVLDRIAAVLAAQAQPDHVDLSLACPKGGDFYPSARLARLVADIARRHPRLIGDYSLPPGSPLLRQEIARHALALGISMTPDTVILTNGCMEALQLALRAITRPGDAVAMESPTYFNLIPLAKRLGLRITEVPTHPGLGMSMDALEMLLAERRISAVVCMPDVHNPLGSGMPIAAKRRLAQLAAEHRVPVIEDALYAELQYTTPLQPAVKAFDRDGWVILCASYTKTLAPGFRVGYMEAGRFASEVRELKFCSSVAQPTVLCEALGAFLESGGYIQHLRRLRRLYAGQTSRLRSILDDAFPAGTRATEPTGGFLLWVELPEGCDADRLFHDALAHGISITPGTLFSPSGRYRRHLRLSGCYPFSDRHVHALYTLGRLASRQLDGAA